MFSWSRLRVRCAALSAAAAVLGAAALVASAIASGENRPTIVGDPVVGNLLSVTHTGEFDGLYRWQSCDPAVADCFASTLHDDPGWTDLPARVPERHNNPPFPIVSGGVGAFIRVLTPNNSIGPKWLASGPVGPV